MTSESVITDQMPKPESLAARFNDWLNPIVVKELRQAVQSRFVVAALLILLVIQIIAVGIYLLTSGDPTTDFDAGRWIFMILFGILLGISLLFVPLYSGVRLAAERSETNLDLLFITTIKPRSIIAGKLLAAVILTILIFSACLPFLTFTYFLRGIDLPSMLVTLTLGFAVVVICAQMAIFIACLAVNRAFKFMIGLIALGNFIGYYIAVLAFSGDMLMRGVGSKFGDPDFWQWTGALTLIFTFTVGLFFVLSVALITPMSANRALLVRAFLTIAWLVGGIVALIFSKVESTHDPVIFWQGQFNIIFAIALFTAVSERDQPGTRVLRSVPKSGLKRLASFFLFSGSASGLAWTCAMIAATYFVCWGWWRLFPIHTALSTLVGSTRWFAMMNLYLLCYALTGALLRRHVLHRVGTELTWLLSTLLTVIGSVIPFLIGSLIFMNAITWWQEDYGKWLVGNPFVWDVAPQRTLYLSVGIAWAVVAVALNLPWFLKRAKHFKAQIQTEAQ